MTSLHDDIERLKNIVRDKLNQQVSLLADCKRLRRTVSDLISESEKLRAILDMHGLSSRDANEELVEELTNIELERKYNEAILAAITELNRRIAILDRHEEELKELVRQQEELIAQSAPAMEFNLPLFEP